MEVTFICLANSRKLSGRCVAGIRTDGQGWVRPVSKKPYGTLSSDDYRLEGTREAGLLDVITVDFAGLRPEPHQQENMVLGRERWSMLDWVLGAPKWKLSNCHEIT